MKSMVAVVVLVVLVLTGGVGYGLKHSSKNNSAVTALAVSDINEVGGLGVASAAKTNEPQATGLLGAGNSNAAEATLQSNVGQSGSSSPSQSYGPETFGVYDKQKDDQTGSYIDFEVGTGNIATSDKDVAMLYKGYLTNGQMFDQSRSDGNGKLQTFDFNLTNGAVIEGWKQTIVGMKVGGIRRLIIPPAVGYGASGNGPIPPNAVLVFDVQLVAVK